MTQLQPNKISTLAKTMMALSATASLFLLASPGLAADEEAAKNKSEKEVGSMYLEYMVGLSHSPNQTLRSNDAVPSLDGSTDNNAAGYFVGVALGHRFMHQFRAELQVGYRASTIEKLSVRGEDGSAGSSRLSLFSAMINGYYDLDLEELLSLDVPLTPWVGVGIGWGMPRLDVQNSGGANQLSVDDTDSVFVYNAMTGVTYRISETTEWTVGYRYIATEDFDISGTSAGATRNFDFEFDAHEAYTGIRFMF